MRPTTVDKNVCQKSNGGDPFKFFKCHSGLLTLSHFAKSLWQIDCFSQNLCKLVSYRLCGESSGLVLARTVSVTVLEALWVSPCFVPRDCIPAVSQQLTQHMHMSAAQAETCILPRPKGVIRRKPFPVHNMPDFSQGDREEKNAVVRRC